MLPDVEATEKTVVLGMYPDTQGLLALRVASPPRFGPQVVDTVITAPSLIPGKLVCTPTKEGEGPLMLPWHAQETLIFSNVFPSPEADAMVRTYQLLKVSHI